MTVIEGLIVHEELKTTFPTMVVAFAGWPDAAEAATRAMQYLVKNLPAEKFAEIDPEEFYDFTEVRPYTRLDDNGERIVTWPTNDFYYYAPEDESRRLILYVGTEPNLRWRAFSRILTTIAERGAVQTVISLGALLDEVPHTREPKITGRASTPELEQKAEWLGVRTSHYQGPTGIHTALMEACKGRGLAHASIWGHSPHYVNNSPNPAVSHSLLIRLRSLIDIDVDLEELRLAAVAGVADVTETIAQEPDVSEYVQRLEQRYDAEDASTDDIPMPEDMVQELERFLKGQRKPPDVGA